MRVSLKQHRVPLVLTVAGVLGMTLLVPASGQTSRDADQLQQRLKKFPEADANGDGVLTTEEARAHQQRLKQRKARASSEPDAAASSRAPFAADVAYGPHARHRLDL